jgi:hypothetical protein
MIKGEETCNNNNNNFSFIEANNISSLIKIKRYYPGIDNIISNITNHYIYEILMNGISPIISFHSPTHQNVRFNFYER